MQTVNKLLPTLLGVLCLYLLGYGYARVFIFHTVEHYAGVDGKGKPRQDYIAKKDRPAGEGWEYQLFLPAIKVEEHMLNYFHNGGVAESQYELKLRSSSQHHLAQSAFNLLFLVDRQV